MSETCPVVTWRDRSSICCRKSARRSDWAVDWPRRDMLEVDIGYLLYCPLSVGKGIDKILKDRLGRADHFGGGGVR